MSFKGIFHYILCISFLCCSFTNGLANLGDKLTTQLKTAKQEDKAAIYLQLARLYVSVDNDRAMQNAEAAQELAKKNKDDALQAEAFGIMGDVYTILDDKKNALKSYEEELNLLENISMNKHLAWLYYHVASLYREQNKLRKASLLYKKSLEIAEKIGEKSLIPVNYEALFSTYYDIGRYKEALAYFKEYIVVKDSLFKAKKKEEITALNDEKKEEILKVISGFENQIEEKDTLIGQLNVMADLQKQEIKNKELEIAKKNIERNSLIVLVVLVLSIIFLVSYLYILKRRANEKLAGQNFEIQKQKEEIEIQRDAIASQLNRLEELNIELQRQKEEITAQRDEIEDKKLIIEYKNSEITKSIQYALKIQQAIFPPIEEITNVFPGAFVLYRPKDIVSGDFYWIATTRDNRTFIAASDCSGHGVPGGFMSMIGIEKLNKIVNRAEKMHGLHPAQILTLLDKEIKESLRQTKKYDSMPDGMDMALCEFDFNTGNVYYSGAKRPLWLFKNEDGQMVEYAPVKKSIGGYYEEGLKFKNYLLDISHGDMIYIFSDGYEDQFGGEKNKKLRKKNLQTIFASVYRQESNQQLEFLNNFFDTWKKNEFQVDDVMIVGIRYYALQDHY